IEHDTEIFKSAQKQDIAEFVFRGVSGKQSGLKALFKRKSESELQEESIHASIAAVCELIKNALATGGETDE
ncbi:MAG: hypothetical protein GXY05_02610, partial [Clostridiales bacterium]|nr:hypothetical protein [Clostridiales bacterium]